MDPVSGKFQVPVNQPSLRDTAKLIAGEAPQPEVADAVVRGENNDLGLMPKNAGKAEEAEFSAEAFGERHKCMIGTTIGGAAIGGIVGGIISYSAAMAEVNAQPVNTVKLDWSQPVMQEKVVGQMPADYYEPNNGFGMFHNNVLRDVTAQAPVVGSDGKPVMQPVHKEWVEHGKPVVNWDDKSIKNPTFRGFNESRWEDSHTESDYVGKDSEGRDMYVDRKEIDGWRHDFSADIDYKTIGTYKSPDVRFETGVNVAGRTVIGILAGMGAGAVSCALVGAGIEKVMQNRTKC